jgi:hypothetical protein
VNVVLTRWAHQDCMPGKWVDNTSYFGANRRKRPNKRLLDRRRYDDAGDPPPLAALLRRLRVRLGGVTPEDKRQALEILKAAIAESNRLGYRRCAAALLEADRALRAGAREGPAMADDCVVQALDHAAGKR